MEAVRWVDAVASSDGIRPGMFARDRLKEQTATGWGKT